MPWQYRREKLKRNYRRLLLKELSKSKIYLLPVRIRLAHLLKQILWKASRVLLKSNIHHRGCLIVGKLLNRLVFDLSFLQPFYGFFQQWKIAC